MRTVQPCAVLLPSSELISFLPSSIKHSEGTSSVTDLCSTSLLCRGCLQPVPTLQPLISPLLGWELQAQQLIGVAAHVWFPAASLPPLTHSCAVGMEQCGGSLLASCRHTGALLVLGSSACPLPGPPLCSAPASPQRFLHQVTRVPALCWHRTATAAAH